MKHGKAMRTIVLAIVLDVLAGLGFATAEHLSSWTGLYWALSTATTVGYGDVVPHTVAGHILAAFVMCTVIPLFAATFSMFTTVLTADHVKIHLHDSRNDIKKHVSEQLAYHLGGENGD